MRSHTTMSSRGLNASRRRGVAMLLVLISLMMATILTVAYLSSRDNSTAIGENVADAAAARWAASSGIEVAVSILETESDWRTLHNDGRLVTDFNVAGAAVDIDLLDISTNAPPTAESNHIHITVTASVGEIEQVATAVAAVSTTADGTVDIDLSEFAVFASTGMQIADTATITRWATSPMARFGTPIYLGTHATSAASIRLDSSSKLIDATVYHLDGASNFLVTDTNVEKRSLSDPVPMPLAPPVDPGTPESPPPVIDANSSMLVSGDTRYDSVRMRTPSGVMTIQGNSTVTIDGDFQLDDNAGLIVDGEARMIVLGRFRMDPGSYIELRPDATLQMFLGDEVVLTDAYIGNERADKSVRDVGGYEPYMNVERLVLFGSEPADLMFRDWRIDGTSVVKATLYGPFVDLAVGQDAAVYGRTATNTLVLANNSSLYYDPALDERRGYTNPKSEVFDSDGRILTSLLSCASLDDVLLETIATTEDIAISLLGRLIGTVDSLVDTSTVDMTDPTPRPIPVEFNLVSAGTDVQDWERSIAGP